MTKGNTQIPTVSVVIPSYNHDKYIEECLDSILSQSFQDFEIIITDDGSTDKTLERIATYTDDRIHIFENVQNRGAAFTANRCIENSSGKYIAMLSSDDVWLPNKLQNQVDFLECHPDVYAVFSKVNWIDEDSNLINSPSFYYNNVFEVENRSRFDWLHHFFFIGNCICHPSGLIRRAAYTECGGYNPFFANLPDLDLWVRLCMKYEIFILEERLINFRHFNDGTNASGQTLPNLYRIIFEDFQIMDHYKKIHDVDIFLKVFPMASQFTNIETEDLHFILGKISVETGVDYKVLWGQDLLLETLSCSQRAERIRRKFDFDYPDFLKITSSFDTFSAEGRYRVGGSDSELIKTSNDENITNYVKSSSKKLNLLSKLIRFIHLKRNMLIITQSGIFDQSYYKTQNPDVIQKGIDPVKHYLLYGSDEGRNPSRLFNTKRYVVRYPDVQVSRINPLIHFILYGRKEGRNPL